MKQIDHASLFSGIGGFDYASKIKGWNNKFYCEIDKFCLKVLKYHYPNSIAYEDITKTDFTFWRGKIDVLSGGFPCQPYSQAGKRLGKADERHLWPQMLRAIKEIKPTYVVGENVYGIVNWNGGMVFDEVQTDLENQGYEVLAIILPAASVNAPHKRDRTFFIAYSNQFRNSRKSRKIPRATKTTYSRRQKRKKPTWQQIQQLNQSNNLRKYATNANRPRFQKTRTQQPSARLKQYGKLHRTYSNTNRQRCNGRGSNWQKRHFQNKQKRQSTQAHTNRTKHELKFSTFSQIKYATHTHRIRRRRLPNKSQTARTQQSNEFFRSARRVQVNANTNHKRQQRRKLNGIFNTRRIQQKWKVKRQPYQPTTQLHKITNWRDFPTQSPVCSRNDELSTRLHNITFSKWRRESIKAYGNAVVPELVLRLFNVIEKMLLDEKN